MVEAWWKMVEERRAESGRGAPAVELGLARANGGAERTCRSNAR